MIGEVRLPDELSFLKDKILDLGFNSCGYSGVTRPLNYEKYKQWLEKGYHGEMLYLQKHLQIKQNLQEINPQIKSIFSLTHPYRVLSQKNKDTPLNSSSKISSLKIALYAQDEDYHVWLMGKLEALIRELQVFFPNEFFRATTDSFPILERDFAYQNGLGWIGKNSCLIHPKQGSFFLIGNILSSLYLKSEVPTPLHDFCGKCNRCIEACPTSAIQENRTLDAKRCISYWTIESKSIPPDEIKNKIGDHFFGCDICQTVCPWNQKVGIPIKTNDLLASDLRFILEASAELLKEKFKTTALSRSKAFGLKRNALIVIANKRIEELRPEVETLLSDERIGSLAAWTLAEMSRP